MPIPDTPLFVKTHDFLIWLIRHTQRFPKNLRFTFTAKLENLALEFHEAILMANSVQRGQRQTPIPVPCRHNSFPNGDRHKVRWRRALEQFWRGRSPRVALTEAREESLGV